MSREVNKGSCFCCDSSSSSSSSSDCCSYEVKGYLMWGAYLAETGPDLDLYARRTGAGTCYYNNMSAGGLSLNVNALPDCSGPAPPEIIWGDFTSSEEFRFWWNMHSDCSEYKNPDQMYVRVTNTGPKNIKVRFTTAQPLDGSQFVTLTPGQETTKYWIWHVDSGTSTSSNRYGDISDFSGIGTTVEVECDPSCGSSSSSSSVVSSSSSSIGQEYCCDVIGSITFECKQLWWDGPGDDDWIWGIVYSEVERSDCVIQGNDANGNPCNQGLAKICLDNITGCVGDWFNSGIPSERVTDYNGPVYCNNDNPETQPSDVFEPFPLGWATSPNCPNQGPGLIHGAECQTRYCTLGDGGVQDERHICASCWHSPFNSDCV